MKVYSYPRKIENNVVFKHDGCIMLNGHHIGIWDGSPKVGYDGFLFEKPNHKREAWTKPQLLKKLTWQIVANQYFKS